MELKEKKIEKKIFKYYKTKQKKKKKMYSILLLEDDLLFASSIEDFLVCEGFL